MSCDHGKRQVLTTVSEDADGQPLGLIRQAIQQANTPSNEERIPYVLNAFPGTGKTKALFYGSKVPASEQRDRHSRLFGAERPPAQ